MTIRDLLWKRYPTHPKRVLWVMTTTLLIGLALYYLIPMYIHYYVPEELSPYTIRTPQRNDDTLSIVVIGDSWAQIHNKWNGDSILTAYARNIYNIPIKSTTLGKGFATTKDIYLNMFNYQVKKRSYDAKYCTQPLIEEHPNYCIIFAGINDAIMQRPTYYYSGTIKSIIRLLLHNNIRPVIMEMPLFSYEGAISWRTQKEKAFLLVRGYLMGTWDNDVMNYRKALNEMLKETGLKDSILYISTEKWNPKGWKENNMYGEDGVHLNIMGYHVLDSCITSEVTKDYIKRKMIKK